MSTTRSASMGPSSDPGAPAGPGRAAGRPTIAWVAWVRLVAVLGVICIHSVASNAAAARRGQHTPANLLAVWLDIAFIVAVPLFVMVSGTLTLNPASFRGPGPYVRKRVLRTLPALVVWHLAYLAYLQLWLYPTPLPAREVVGRIMSGRLVPHLYFLWIVLGLSLLAPVLVRWLREASRREQVITGLGLAAVPVLTSATRSVRGNPVISLDTAWSWWVPYLGLFVLGWALRGVVLRGAALVAAAVAGLGLVSLQCVQFPDPRRFALLEEIAPVSYYGASAVVASILLFLVAQATVREGGVLGVLARPPVLRVVDPIASASLGIYACHVMILWTIVRLGWFGPSLTTAPQMLARLGVTIVLSVLVTLAARRVPLLDRIF